MVMSINSAQNNTIPVEQMFDWSKHIDHLPVERNLKAWQGFFFIHVITASLVHVYIQCYLRVKGGRENPIFHQSTNVYLLLVVMCDPTRD